MTPAIDQAKTANIDFVLHEYKHDPRSQAYGEEAVQKLSLAPEQVFKTLVLSEPEGSLLVALVPALKQLDLKALAKFMKLKKVQLAEPAKVQRSTGYVLGGVSPLGQKQCLTTLIDSSAQSLQRIYVSAGRRGLELELNISDLAFLTRAKFADIAR